MALPRYKIEMALPIPKWKCGLTRIIITLGKRSMSMQIKEVGALQ
jgi:hypothetical protein